MSDWKEKSIESKENQMKRVNVRPDQMSYGLKEELNTLRTNIQFSGVDKKVIMVTSCMSGEGKSNTVFHLANSLAELGKKVLILDADMRKSVMVRNVKDGTIDKGLSHYLSGQCNLAEAVCSTDVRGLHMIFAGPVPPNPTELLSSDLFSNTLKSFREIYDYVLVDTAPLGLVVDAAIVAKNCDASILLIEANSIKYRFAQSVKEKLVATECPILGVVLNKVDYSNGGRNYGKHYHNYGHQYAKYYESDENAPKLEEEAVKKS